MLIDLLLGSICLIAIGTAACAYAAIRAGAEYDNWVEEFEANGGVQTSLSPILYGSEIVGYTVVGERRQNRS